MIPTLQLGQIGLSGNAEFGGGSEHTGDPYVPPDQPLVLNLREIGFIAPAQPIVISLEFE